jgi:DNA-binding transcriptional MerR regulator
MYKQSIKVMVQGYEMELYTIGHAAKLLNRSVETLRSWERQQVIPRPMFKYKNNVRLYHPKEVDAMKGILRKKKLSREELKTQMWQTLQEVRKVILEHKNEVQA